jgi:hypothetical protein
MAHEAAEAARKLKWEAEQKAKKELDEQVLAEIAAMSDEGIIEAAIQVLGEPDAELLELRDMETCVHEHLKGICRTDAEFARKIMHPRKSIENCIDYIGRHAMEYLREREKKNESKKKNRTGMGGSVPDGVCFKWAVAYFNDSDAKEDKDPDDKFVPKTYYGKSSTKSKKKPPPKKPEPVKPVEQVDLDFGDLEDESA